MNAPATLRFAPWQQRVLDRAWQARTSGRLPHAMLICGPERLGKRAVAEALAQAILCATPLPSGAACGVCPACTQFQSRYQRDPVETRPDESLAHPDGHPGHQDASFVSFALNEKSSPKKMYQELVIEQIRALSAWLALTPSSNRGKVALIEPAHRLNQAAANALLKTLEEPVPGRYLMLVTDQPARLPATIRSRCQRFEFDLPPSVEAHGWLLAQGVNATAASDALAANLGHPGLALDEIRSGGAALRLEVAKDLAALTQGRHRPASIATAWAADRPALRLRMAGEAVREFAAYAARGDASRSSLAQAGLAPGTATAPLAAWFDQANRALGLLRTPLRQDLLLTELLLAWREQIAATVRPAASRR
jgi:DNA polymerase-3 subunit delta'